MPWPLHLVRVGHHRRLHHGGVLVDGILDFGRAEAVAAHVNHVVDAADDAVEALLVAAGAVAGEVVAGVGREVDLLTARMVAPGGADDGRPALLDGQVAFLAVTLDFGAVLAQQHRLYARQRQARLRGHRGRYARQGRNQNAPGFGLPPRVHDGAALLAHVHVVPVPGFLVDGLAHRAQHPQRVERVAEHVVERLGHEGADGGGAV